MVFAILELVFDFYFLLLADMGSFIGVISSQRGQAQWQGSGLVGVCSRYIGRHGNLWRDGILFLLPILGGIFALLKSNTCFNYLPVALTAFARFPKLAP
jgi:hypothetical protein